ncbi:hypothetical protein ElyMa_003526900 [Elysia marginata]|uniref:Uncharacterized protein n=1 Tax=Elysia marginata TaxID=1093978 RepID=A0AAV4EJ84_9GAST|nr:hypothetical protein ElyMa_003526900 [Elysia marginata]
MSTPGPKRFAVFRTCLMESEHCTQRLVLAINSTPMAPEETSIKQPSTSPQLFYSSSQLPQLWSVFGPIIFNKY